MVRLIRGMAALRNRSFSKLPFESSGLDDDDLDDLMRGRLSRLAGAARADRSAFRSTCLPVARCANGRGLEAERAPTVTMATARAASRTRAAANGRFDIVIHYSRRSDLSGGLHPGGGAMVADHHRRHSGLQLRPIRPDRRPADRRQHRADRRRGRNSRTGRAGSAAAARSRLPAHGEMEFDSADVAQHVRERDLDQRHPARDRAHSRHRHDLEPARSQERRGRLHRRPRPCRIPRAVRQSVGGLGSDRA